MYNSSKLVSLITDPMNTDDSVRFTKGIVSKNRDRKKEFIILSNRRKFAM